MGFPSVFVRLSGCNLMCGGNGTQRDRQLHDGATWRCDTIEVWLKGTQMRFEEILNKEQTDAIRDGAHLIITGGEPLLHEDGVIEFIRWVRDNINPDVFVEIETNGTKIPSPELINLGVLFNCSPKLSNSGMPSDRRIIPDAIKAINRANSIFKFVVSKPSDVEEILSDYHSMIDPGKIWIMPAGENQILLNLSKPICAYIAKQHRWKLSTRMHIEIWNQKTGV